MATFLETKVLIGRMLGIREVNEDNDLVIDLNSWRFTRHSSRSFVNDDGTPKQIVISNEELKAAYDKISNLNFEGLELYSNTTYELAIDLDTYMSRQRDVSIKHDDIPNGLVYELGKPTIEYCIGLMVAFLDSNESFKTTYRNPPIRFMRPMDSSVFRDDLDNITLTTILQAIIGETTLKIRTANGNNRSINQFRMYKTSFLFEFMYKSNIATIEYSSVEDIFYRNASARENYDASLMDTPPAREYTADVVDYYKLALSSRDPYIKYLSFYHIIEYFFDEVFKKKMIADLKDKITHPDFSYKSDEKIYEVARFVKNRWKMNDESGQGDELESLKFVLNEYITVGDLKFRINAINPNAVNYYQSNKVSFCDAPSIGWNDTQGAITQIAKRVYYTRNALVHSKSGKNKERYRPYNDEKQLQKEIPLLKAIAESIIINSSKILE